MRTTLFLKFQGFISRNTNLFLLAAALSLQDLHDDLLLFDQESADDLLPDSRVAEDSTVGTVDGLQPLAHPGLLLVGCGLDTLQPQAGHGTFRDTGPLLEILEHQFTARGPNSLGPVGPGVVGKATPVGDSLNHFVSEKRKIKSQIISASKILRIR